jgi:cyclomaltodextrinase / maltogenic alpha-amylase / neopullulanase
VQERRSDEAHSGQFGPPLTRRAVLSAGLAALAGTAVSGLAPAVAGARKQRAPTLWPADADVWALAIDVEGTPAGAQLTVDGQPVATASSTSGFTAQVPLGPGENTLIVSAPPSAATSTRSFLARIDERPTARASVSVSGGIVRLDASDSEPDPYTGAPIVSTSWRWREGDTLGDGAVLVLEGPWSEGEQYVTASVTDANGHTDESTVVFVVSDGEPLAVETRSWQPEWVRDAIVYGAVPPLFGQPPLEALAAQLDRLARLGINVLWLSPIFATTPGEFGYAVTDYFAVRPDYGDLESLRALVAAAHARNIMVILDLPLNDTSDQHPYYAQAREDTTGSHYWDFYERNAKGTALHYFNWKHLPNLNYENAEVRRMATAVAVYWLREAGVDGFRCDAAWGVQERDPEFWVQWRAELQRIRPDLLLLAEGSARESTWAASGFSAAYDWSEEPGEWAWEGAFARKRVDVAALRAALTIATGSRPFRFLEDNDTGERFITRYGAGTARAAAAMLLSLPGMPCIYTGQEIGAEYEPYQQSEALDWSRDPNGLEPYYQQLIGARRASPILASGALTLLTATPEADVLAYAVTGAEGTTVVAVNYSASEVEALVDTGDGEETALQLPAYSAMTVPSA